MAASEAVKQMLGTEVNLLVVVLEEGERVGSPDAGLPLAICSFCWYLVIRGENN